MMTLQSSTASAGAVVLGTLLGIGKDRICVGDLGKLLLSVRGFVDVRVRAQGQLAVCLLNLSRSRIAFHAQNIVRIWIAGGCDW